MLRRIAIAPASMGLLETGPHGRQRCFTASPHILFAPSSPSHSAAVSAVTVPWAASRPAPANGPFTEVASGSSATPTSTRVFWRHTVQQVNPYDLKRIHTQERAVDKRSRFVVRTRLRADGVVSNLYPLHFPTGKTEGEVAGGTAPLYVYEMYVTRRVTHPAGGLLAPDDVRRRATHAKTARPPPRRSVVSSVPSADGTTATEERRVSPLRAWHAIRRSLHKRYATLPAMVQLEQKLYTTAPLPGDALRVPAEFHDLGWVRCELRLLGPITYTDLTPPQLQELVNKIVPAVVRDYNKAHATFEVVRDVGGKLVCTSGGVSAGGLRVFKGSLVQAVFVDTTQAATMEPDSVHRSPCSTSGPGFTTAQQLKPVVSPPASRDLAEVAPGTTGASQRLTFLVAEFLRGFTYRGRYVESYKISDASGTYLASLWEPTNPSPATRGNGSGSGEAMEGALRVGRVYSARQVRVRVFPERANMRLFELTASTSDVKEEKPKGDTQSTGSTTDHTAEAHSVSTGPSSSSSHTSPDAPITGGAGAFPGQLGLKIDTKGTIASETSLWEEIKQHFGPGPYDEETQRRITQAVQGTPVVTAMSLRQGIVRLVRFNLHDHHPQRQTETSAAHRAGNTEARASPSKNGTLPANADGAARSGAAPSALSGRLLDESLTPLLPYLDPGQPYAVFPDYSVWPLQVLHCCFDPRMRGWQDIAIAVLSLMPTKRSEVLGTFRQLLAEGLLRWGLRLGDQPWRTKALSLLPAPQKAIAGRGYAAAASVVPQRHPLPVAFPTTVLVVGITGSRRTSEEISRVTLTAQSFGKYFKTNLVACVEGEAEAATYVRKQMVLPSAAGGERRGGDAQLRDANAAVLLITPDRETRATRWMMAESLCSGILPIAIPPAGSPKRISLLCGNVRRQLAAKFEVDPLRGVDLAKEVPVVARKRVLVVGVDSCHTNAQSTGAVVGVLSTPQRNHVLPIFWKHEARGREVQHVSEHFRVILAQAAALYDGLDEVIVFQDGDVFSELNSMKGELARQLPGCGLTFMCLHKRSNIRFVHDATAVLAGNSTGSSGGGGGYSAATSSLSPFNNVVKGVVIPALTPSPLDYEVAAPSFYLQTHECNMSTARIVQYTVHHTSPTIDVSDVQQLANVMANVLAPMATKLPISTRCAHRVAGIAERLLDAVPQMRCDMIPSPLNQRMWFL